jgi:hypothetical protein
MEYKAAWNAKSLNEGRMIVDDFKALAPTGQAVSSYVTLRTYSETKHRWEMTGLAALQPAVNAEWFGEWNDGEMLMSATGKDPAGNRLISGSSYVPIANQKIELLALGSCSLEVTGDVGGNLRRLSVGLLHSFSFVV